MEIKDFLQKLLDFGKQEGYFEETTIGQLDKSCCKDSITTIIDFDRTKDIIVSELIETSTSIEKQISGIVKMEIDKIPGSPFNNIQKPQLMNCKSIDDYYASNYGASQS